MTEAINHAAPFRLPASALASLPDSVASALRALCERVLAFPALNAVYEHIGQQPAPASFFDRALNALRVRVQVNDEDLRHIPTRGPLIIVANHPFGGLDGVVLGALIQRVRPDARLLANFLLRSIPEMDAHCFYVDPFGGSAAPRRNRAGMKSAMQWVVDGGALAVFPAGEVSHLTLRSRCVTDPTWSDTLGRLALRTRATVVPLYFHGQNSPLFQLLGLLHPRLRTAMLPRELLRLRGQTVRVEIGTPIPAERLQQLRSNGAATSRSPQPCAAQVTEYLRLRTYILRGRTSGAPRASARAKTNHAAQQPIVAPAPASALAAEVSALPADQRLGSSGSMQVFVGSAAQMPGIVREIGRLREITFRLVGEGTGRAIDLDRFDSNYLHLFVWNTETSAVVGAYRMGQTDVLLDRFGAAGLYTSTLFRYRPGLLDQLRPALELGRSFVVPEHQRDYAPLLLLWKGIGQYVVRHPRYRWLFGAVSISDEFHSMTKQLLMAFLRAHSFDQAAGACVQPRNPPRWRRFRDADARLLSTLVNDLSDVEELVAEIESSRRGVPVLLRQYLKLNAKLLGFNIDPDFGDVLDGLVLVDLAAADRRVLSRYMGREGVESFHAHHCKAESAV